MGQKPKTTIEINGKRYDAITGEPVADAVKSAPQAPAPAPANARSNPAGSIGGVIAPPAKPAVTKPTPAHSKQVHAPPKRSQLLSRQAIKPQARPAASHTTDPDNQEHSPARRQLADNIDQARQHRSSRHVKSPAISKFSAGTPAADSAEPAEQFPVIPDSEPKVTPVFSPKEQLIAAQLAKVVASSPPPPAKVSLGKRVARKLRTSRGTSVTATSIAALLLIGYVTYLNVPRMALRVASGRAGFSAELPGYAPSGFRFSGPVAYAPGELTIQYSSNTDERAYSIKEQTSNWDSQTLLDNYVSQETELYSTYQQRGLTIYVFDGSTATWVNGGLWFTVSGDAGLNSEQLLKIAASL